MNVTYFSDLLYTVLNFLKGKFGRKQKIVGFGKIPDSEINTSSFVAVYYHPTPQSAKQNLVHKLKSSSIKSLIKRKIYLHYSIKMDKVAKHFSLQLIRIKI